MYLGVRLLGRGEKPFNPKSVCDYIFRVAKSPGRGQIENIYGVYGLKQQRYGC